MTTPTPAPVIIPAGQQPSDVGLMQLRFLSFNMQMTDDEMRALAEQAISLRNTYTQWQEFHDDLDARKKRLLGFQAVVLALDVNAAATAMNTTPELVTGTMNGYAQQEQARITELQAMWDAGQLPTTPVLSDPSKAVVDGSDATTGTTTP